MKNQLNRIHEARTSQPTGTNSGLSCDGDVSLSPEVQRATERWLPQNVTPDQRAMLPVVLPVVRCWVAAARPSTPKEARVYLWATIQIALWAYSEFQTLNPRVVLSIHNVEYFTTFECADRSNGWRQEVRWKLRCVGRAANPDGWPPKPPQLGPSPIVLPYSAAEEAMFVHAARGSEASNRASRLAVAGFSLGAGLKGNEIKVLTPEDVVEHNSGVITVRVAGRHPRLVPIRASVKTIAIDSTAVESWACSKEFTKQQALEKDLYANYRKASLENPDLPEPELKRQLLAEEARRQGLQVGRDGTEATSSGSGGGKAPDRAPPS